MSAAAPADAVEIWIRSVGSRRQAFYRPCQPAGQRTRGWHSMLVSVAEKALRTGVVTVGGYVNAGAVVSRETQEVEHPAAAAFRENAQLLNRAIDSINGTARGAA